MTDWFEMVESMQNAMQAVDKAHAASQQLRQNATGKSVKNFHDEMMALARHLEQLERILDNNQDYTMDEIAEAIGHSMGTPHTYHRMGTVENK